jgi:hypothetical protein
MAAQAATPGYDAAGEAVRAAQRAASEARASIVRQATTTPGPAAAASVASDTGGAVAPTAPAQSAAGPFRSGAGHDYTPAGREGAVDVVKNGSPPARLLHGAAGHESTPIVLPADPEAVPPDEPPTAATVLGPNTLVLITRAESLASQNPAVITLAPPLKLTGDSPRELGQVIVSLAGWELPGPMMRAALTEAQQSRAAGQTRPRVLRARLAVLAHESSEASYEQYAPSFAAASEATNGPIGTARRTHERNPALTRASAAVTPIPYSSRTAVRAVIGMGASGEAPPAVALWAVAGICMALALLHGRLGLDPFLGRSALLTSRLERPG